VELALIQLVTRNASFTGEMYAVKPVK
jgi:hypothetical protein